MPFRALLRRKLRYRDATHDVQKLDAASEDFEPVTDPTATNGDIKDVFIHYRAGGLVIRANYVDLRPRTDTQMVFTGEIKTNEKRRWLYQVETSPGNTPAMTSFAPIATTARPARSGTSSTTRRTSPAWWSRCPA